MHDRRATQKHPRYPRASGSDRSVIALALLTGTMALCTAPRLAGAQAPWLGLQRVTGDKPGSLKVYLSYADKDGAVLAGQAPKNFHLIVDSVDQGAGKASIAFEQTKEPISVVAVVQASAATQAALPQVKQGLRKLYDAVAGTPGGRIGILTYAVDTKRLLEFGTKASIDDALNKLSTDGRAGDLHLLDAVRTGLELLAAQDKSQRKLLVVYSDGADVSSDRWSFVKLGRFAAEKGIVIDPIGAPKAEASKLHLLGDMAKRSYGFGRTATTEAEVGVRFAAVIDELQKQYVMTFPLSGASDGMEHTCQVVNEVGDRPAYSDVIYFTHAGAGGPVTTSPGSSSGGQAHQLNLQRVTGEKPGALRVYVSYQEKDGSFIGDEPAARFHLLLDAADQGAATGSSSFEQTREPISVMAVVQASAATQAALPQVKQGLRKLYDAVAAIPGGRMGILTYAADTKRLLEFGTKASIDDALNKLSTDGRAGDLHLLDAVRTGLELLAAQDKSQRKLLIVYSDGADVSTDRRAFTSLGYRAAELGIVILPIGAPKADPDKLRLLGEMSRRSYGFNRIAPTELEIGPRFAAVTDELRKQYVLTFTPRAGNDGKEHTIQIAYQPGGWVFFSNIIEHTMAAVNSSPVPK